MQLFLDIETYSDVDLNKSGVYRYTESPSFEILLIAWSIDQAPVQVLDLKGPRDPTKSRETLRSLIALIRRDDVIKVAHNAAFERVCFSRFIYGVSDKFLPPENWRDTMIMARELALPSGLAQLGEALGLPEDKKKMAVGKRLINLFCKPVKPTKANGNKTRILPENEPEKWQLFKEYCRMDVVTEIADYNRLASYWIPAKEWQLYCNDQRINDAGIPVDTEIVESVLKEAEAHLERMKAECYSICGLNLTSVVQLKAWLRDTQGIEVEKLDKESVATVLGYKEITPYARRVLELRAESSKTSVKKYKAFSQAVCADGRIRGGFAFFGGRTGRYAGRLIQPHNFPRNEFPDFDFARWLIKNGDFKSAESLFPSMNSVFSTLVRTLVSAPKGRYLAVADYSAIEARVLAWVSDTQWRLDAFAKGRDIYCESASQMFGVPVEKHGVNGELRQKGKVAELACGYGGGIKALKAFGADKLGLSDSELTDIVHNWRKASPEIKKFWYALEGGIRKAIELNLQTTLPHGIRIYKDGAFLFIALPSGRSIAYPEPEILPDGEISYMGQNTARQWVRLRSWGGKFTENVVQAIARDCLADALLKLEKHPEYQVVMHVHDEVVVEVPDDDPEKHLEIISDIMGEALPWAPGLLLRADGFTSPYYKKD